MRLLLSLQDKKAKNKNNSGLRKQNCKTVGVTLSDTDSTHRQVKKSAFNIQRSTFDIRLWGLREQAHPGNNEYRMMNDELRSRKNQHSEFSV